MTDFYGAIALETWSQTPEDRARKEKERREAAESERRMEDMARSSKRSAYENAVAGCDADEAESGHSLSERRDYLRQWRQELKDEGIL